MWTSFKVSAPGSLMVMGEHAVLHGSRAMACAVNSRITIAFEPVTDSVLSIHSALGSYSSPLHALTPSHDFRFILEALKGIALDSGGLHLDIHSEFSHTVGLGSSAAVTVCAVAGRQHLESGSMRLITILEDSRRVIRSVQGSGSATDAAASTYGGLIAFQPKTLEVVQLPLTFPITLRYAGYKTPTPEVIARVQAWAEEDPDTFQRLYREMGAVVEQAVSSAQASDLHGLTESARRYQSLMRNLGVSDDHLEAIIKDLEADPGISAAKISGSGLGDCVIGLGQAERSATRGDEIPVAIEQAGVRIEPN